MTNTSYKLTNYDIDLFDQNATWYENLFNRYDCLCCWLSISYVI